MKSPRVHSAFSLLSPAGPGGRLSILLFHKIPTVADPLVPDELNLQGFENILDFLANNANVMPLLDATAALQAGKLPKGAMALTFDDGYAEWIDNVSPALRKRDLPATFFVTTGHLAGGALWHERIIAAVRALPDLGFSLPYGFGNCTDLGPPAHRRQLVQDLQERLKYASLSERVGAIEMLEAQTCRAIMPPRAFTGESVRTLHNQGFDIGAHTVQHPILTESTPSQARTEIGACKEELEGIIGARVECFAYPNGRPNADYGREHVDMVKSLGYTLAVTTSGGAATRDADVFQLPRFTPWGVSDASMAFQLARNMRTRPTPLKEVAQGSGNATSAVRCLLVADAFPPSHGGEGVLTDQLCQYMPQGSMRILAFHDNASVAARPRYPVDLIRFSGPGSTLKPGWRQLFHAFPAYAKALVRAAQLMRTHAINVICIDDSAASGWLGIALKKLYAVKVIVFVRGDTLTSGQHDACLRVADRVLATDKATCDALSGMMHVKPTSIVLIQPCAGHGAPHTCDDPSHATAHQFLKMCDRLLSEDLR